MTQGTSPVYNRADLPNLIPPLSNTGQASYWSGHEVHVVDDVENATLEDARLASEKWIALHNEGKFEEALASSQKSLAIRERLAPDSLDVAQSYNNMGVVYKSQGKFSEALDQHKKSLAIRERLAPDSLDVAHSYNNIGKVYESQGKSSEAVELFQKSGAIKKRLVATRATPVLPSTEA